MDRTCDQGENIRKMTTKRTRISGQQKEVEIYGTDDQQRRHGEFDTLLIAKATEGDIKRDIERDFVNKCLKTNKELLTNTAQRYKGYENEMNPDRLPIIQTGQKDLNSKLQTTLHFFLANTKSSHPPFSKHWIKAGYLHVHFQQCVFPEFFGFCCFFFL